MAKRIQKQHLLNPVPMTMLNTTPAFIFMNYKRHIVTKSGLTSVPPVMGRIFCGDGWGFRVNIRSFQNQLTAEQ